MLQNNDFEELKFAVYITAALERVDPEVLVTALNNDSPAEDSPFIVASMPAFVGLGAQAVIARHHAAESSLQLYRNLFIIVDRSIAEGVLMVNLHPYHGYIDALRQAASLAGDSLSSLNIANTDWYEERESVGEEQREMGMVPENRFALYDTLPSDDEEGSFELGMKWMNDGVGEFGVDRDDDQEAGEPPFGTQRSYYRAIFCTGQ